MRYSYPILFLLILSCVREQVSIHPTPLNSNWQDSLYIAVPADSVSPAEIVAFAKTLLGTPYKFGCSAPASGFDCSGFISYVFKHFNIEVPRSSADFTYEGSPVALTDAMPGDLILFTGTNSHIPTVGHIGLVVSNDTFGIRFIHSSSGSENAVIITELDERYMARFVKVIRIRK